LHATGVRSRLGRTDQNGIARDKITRQFQRRRTLKVGDAEYVYFNLIEAEKNGLDRRFAAALFDEGAAGEPAAQRGRPLGHQGDIKAVADWLTDKGTAGVEIAYRPAAC
jgi:aconitate hydratase